MFLYFPFKEAFKRGYIFPLKRPLKEDTPAAPICTCNVRPATDYHPYIYVTWRRPSTAAAYAAGYHSAAGALIGGLLCGRQAGQRRRFCGAFQHPGYALPLRVGAAALRRPRPAGAPAGGRRGRVRPADRALAVAHAVTCCAVARENKVVSFLVRATPCAASSRVASDSHERQL